MSAMLSDRTSEVSYFNGNISLTRTRLFDPLPVDICTRTSVGHEKVHGGRTEKKRPYRNTDGGGIKSPMIQENGVRVILSVQYGTSQVSGVVDLVSRATLGDRAPPRFPPETARCPALESLTPPSPSATLYYPWLLEKAGRVEETQRHGRHNQDLTTGHPPPTRPGRHPQA
jgi:hypothetical protein